MRLTSSSTASSSPWTRLVGAAARFPGRTDGLTAGMVLYPCLALVSRYWKVLKEPFPGLFTPPFPKAIRKSRIHMLFGAPKRHGDGQMPKACSAGLYVLLRALITRWPKNWTKGISNQKFRQRSGTDQLRSQFTMLLFLMRSSCYHSSPAHTRQYILLTHKVPRYQFICLKL